LYSLRDGELCFCGGADSSEHHIGRIRDNRSHNALRGEKQRLGQRGVVSIIIEREEKREEKRQA